MQLRFTCRITTYATFKSLSTFQVDEVGSSTLSRFKKNLIGTKTLRGMEGGYLMKALTHLKFKYESFKMLKNTINLQVKEWNLIIMMNECDQRTLSCLFRKFTVSKLQLAKLRELIKQYWPESCLSFSVLLLFSIVVYCRLISCEINI